MIDWSSQVATGQRSREVQGLLERGSLDEAVAGIEDLVSNSGDSALVEAAAGTRAPALDWTEVVCEGIEADHRLTTLGEGRCAAVVLEIGNHADNRLLVRRFFHGPASGTWDPWLGPASRLGGHHGILTELMEVSALAPLARLQLEPYFADAGHARRVFLAGHLLVLRFFEAVQREASARGLPMPVTLAARVARVGGEDAISQLGPSLALRVPCALRPVDGTVTARLLARHETHVRQWDDDTSTIVRNLRNDFAAKGWVPSSYVPEELTDDKQRLRHLEQHLLIHDPRYRLSFNDVEELAVRVRDARDASRPLPIDPAPYLS